MDTTTPGDRGPEGIRIGHERGRDHDGRPVPYLWVRPASAPVALVAFGHGFGCPPSRYAGTLAHLASDGIAVAAPLTRTGPLPSHAGLAADLRTVLIAGAAAVRRVTGALPPLGLAGHSMGGGAAVLAAAGWPAVGERAGLAPIGALVLLAPMRTRPSTRRAASFVRAPALTITGTADRIVDPAISTAIHEALPASSRWLAIEGGSHCGFLDRPVPFCDPVVLPREEQLRRTRAAANAWFRQHLVGLADGDARW